LLIGAEDGGYKTFTPLTILGNPAPLAVNLIMHTYLEEFWPKGMNGIGMAWG